MRLRDEPSTYRGTMSPPKKLGRGSQRRTSLLSVESEDASNTSGSGTPIILEDEIDWNELLKVDSGLGGELDYNPDASSWNQPVPAAFAAADEKYAGLDQDKDQIQRLVDQHPSDHKEQQNTQQRRQQQQVVSKRSLSLLTNDESGAADVRKLLRTGSMNRIIACGGAADAPDSLNGTAVSNMAADVKDEAFTIKADMKHTGASISIAIGSSSSSSSGKSSKMSMHGPTVAAIIPMDTVNQIVDAFNFCDLASLSDIVRTACRSDCILVTTALSIPITGRNFIMMYWALTMEAFPDAVWVRRGKCSSTSTSTVRPIDHAAAATAAKTKSAATTTTVTISQSFWFSGNRIFNRSTEDLFSYVVHQAEKISPKTTSAAGAGAATTSASATARGGGGGGGGGRSGSLGEICDIDAMGEILQGCWISNKLVPAAAYNGAAGAAGIGAGTGASLQLPQTRVENQDRRLTFTFDASSYQIVRIDCNGDV